MTTVLVIEDQRDLREDVLEQLGFEGFDTLDAPNGRVGVQVARDKLPDIIICDVMMPELDGFGVLFELRSDPLTAGIPFIFLTARADRSDLRKGIELGADDYLTKPFTQAELMGALRVALDKHEKTKQMYGQQAEELRQNLLMILPHEFRTPLTAILGYGELLMSDHRTLAPDQVGRMAQMIVRSGNRLHHLIENYLLYAQVEIVRTDAARISKMRQSRTADAGEVVMRGARKVAVEVGRESDLVMVIERAELPIAVDSLQKIIEELVDNAFKFSQPGAAVSVKTAVGSAFTLTVRDQGRGMTPEQIASIGAYTQFERRLYEQQGLGLGLMLAKGLTELYGGSFEIASSDEGTQVTVKLLL